MIKVAKDNNVDIVVYGHTHIPVYKKIDNIIFINPGSTTYPRGSSKCSFGILTLDKDISYEEIKI